MCCIKPPIEETMLLCLSSLGNIIKFLSYFLRVYCCIRYSLQFRLRNSSIKPNHRPPLLLFLLPLNCRKEDWERKKIRRHRRSCRKNAAKQQTHNAIIFERERKMYKDITFDPIRPCLTYYSLSISSPNGSNCPPSLLSSPLFPKLLPQVTLRDHGVRLSACLHYVPKK